MWWSDAYQLGIPLIIFSSSRINRNILSCWVWMHSTLRCVMPVSISKWQKGQIVLTPYFLIDKVCWGFPWGQDSPTYLWLEGSLQGAEGSGGGNDGLNARDWGRGVLWEELHQPQAHTETWLSHQQATPIPLALWWGSRALALVTLNPSSALK